MSKTASSGNAKKRKAPPHAWKPGQSGNPKGRAAVPPEVREMLAADTVEHYRGAVDLIAKAEAAGDLKTALHGRLSLLRKTVPDATEMVIHVPDGLELRDRRIDLKKFTADEVKAFTELVAKATKGEP